ncbi:MAG: hypothetical protein KDE19_23880, partial [Caldilineaceae bacterium]|nr:hypothetical protein [Caldilineaceae bacterium]
MNTKQEKLTIPPKRPVQLPTQPTTSRRVTVTPQRTTAAILTLQRAIGNRGVQRLLTQRNANAASTHSASFTSAHGLDSSNREHRSQNPTELGFAFAAPAQQTSDRIGPQWQPPQPPSGTTTLRPLSITPAHARIARAPTPSAELQQAREDNVRNAIQFLDTLRWVVSADRRLARAVAAQAGGRAEGSRQAHPRLNQQIVRERLERGRRIYVAQRELLDANHPLQGELRVAYARFLREVRAAFDEALALAQYDRQAELTEQAGYGESLVLWLEASPFRPEALAGRTNFTGADVAASAEQERDLSTVLRTFIPHLNLVQPGMLARARRAINATRNRVTPSTGGAPQRTTAGGATQTAADEAIAQLDGADRTIRESRRLLSQALTNLDGWLQNPTQAGATADRVSELFNTRDPGYGGLLRGRLQLMLTSLNGGGQLFAHMHRPGDTATCTTTSTLGQMPRPYEFEFCGSFRNANSDAGVLLHELAHAVIPGRGTRGSATSGFPLDRAYAGERLLRRMTTEEALNNAESYMQLIAGLAGSSVQSIPTDTVTGCTDTGPLLDAIALAQSAHRRAWSHLQEAQVQLSRGESIESGLRALIDLHLGTPSDSALAEMLEDFGNLQSSATT